MEQVKKTTKKNLMEGHFFNTFDADGDLSHHGYVIGEVSPGTGFMFVQYLDWVCYGPTNQAVVHLAYMASWKFYVDVEDCGNDAERRIKYERCRDAKKSLTNSTSAEELVAKNHGCDCGFVGGCMACRVYQDGTVERIAAKKKAAKKEINLQGRIVDFLAAREGYSSELKEILSTNVTGNRSAKGKAIKELVAAGVLKSEEQPGQGSPEKITLLVDSPVYGIFMAGRSA
jgi:hypothetical protein